MKRMLSLLGATVVALGLTLYSAPPANANVVVNGGFETGDFSGWSEFGDTTFNGVLCGGAPEGSCFAFFGPVGDTGGISQALSLVIGTKYFFSFIFGADGGAPSEFSVSLGGVTLLDLINPAASASGTYSFVVTATSALETLVFTFRDDPGFLSLDAVAVSVPEPGSMALLGMGLVALFMGMRRKSQ